MPKLTKPRSRPTSRKAALRQVRRSARAWCSAAFLLVGLLLGLVSFGNHAYDTLAALGEEANPDATPNAIPNEEPGGGGLYGPSPPLPNSTAV